MEQKLPVILGAGLFDSSNRFGSLLKSAPREVKTYELEYFFENDGISVVNDQEYPVRSRHILLASPGDIRYSYLPFKCKFIHFSTLDAQTKALIHTIPKNFQVELPKISDIFTQITSHFYSANPFDNFVASAELVTLLHALTKQHNDQSDIVTKAKTFIKNNYQYELTTDAIANACNISAPYLYKLFKNRMNLTPGEYLLNCRIYAACDMLSNTNLSINDISFNCGFNSQSYFSKCFKQKNGLSPKDFRQNSKYLP